MPRYTDNRLKNFKEKGFMEFMKYDEFKDFYSSIDDERDRHLACFLYFNGPRPAEAALLKREDVNYDKGKITFRIITLKRIKKRRFVKVGEGIYKREMISESEDRRVRFHVLSARKYPELAAFWHWISSWPDSFYLFPDMRNANNPRDFIRHHLGYSAMFFRHNNLSLMAMAGATREQLKEWKGGKSLTAVEPYLHLSSKEHRKLTRISSRAFT